MISHFSGVEIKPGKPFAHLFDNLRGRLRISQATLGIGSATKKSLVQCNVGNKSPVLLCSLLPDKIESCTLDLEFEEADEVLFSVIGPRSVHLTGYYLGKGRHTNLEDDTDSYGEDIVDTESGESNHDSDEEELEDSFIDDGNPEVYSSSPVSSDGVESEESDEPKTGKGRRLHKKFLKEESNEDDTSKKEGRTVRRRLVKKHQLSDSDYDDNSQQHRTVNRSTATIVLESEDEDSLPISCLYKSENTAKNTKLESEERCYQETSDEGKEKTEDGNRVSGSNIKADAAAVDGEAERGADLPSNSLPPSTKLPDPETGTKSKKKRKERSEAGRPLEDYNATHNNVLKENNTKQDNEKDYNMEQDLIYGKQLDQKPVNYRGEVLPCTNSLLSTGVSPEIGLKIKKRKKERSRKDKTLEAGTSNHSSVLKEENQVGAKADLISKDPGVRKEQDQKPANDKILDNDASHFVDETQSELKKSKKKKRSKSRENEGDVDSNVPLASTEEKSTSVMETDCKNTDSKSSEVRRLPNGLVIEQLEWGKPDSKVASLGKKVSIHYTGKLRENGRIFSSTIDGNSFKFRLGDEEIIEGWNIGLEGMRVGSKRRLTVPPSMAYGSEGDGESIPSNSWLLFDVELVRVHNRR